MPIEPKSDLPDAEKQQFFYDATPEEERRMERRILLEHYLLRISQFFQALKNRLWVA